MLLAAASQPGRLPVEPPAHDGWLIAAASATPAVTGGSLKIPWVRVKLCGVAATLFRKCHAALPKRVAGQPTSGHYFHPGLAAPPPVRGNRRAGPDEIAGEPV